MPLEHMTPDELRAEMARLRLNAQGAADLIGCDERTVFRWLAGERRIPVIVARYLAEQKPAKFRR